MTEEEHESKEQELVYAFIGFLLKTKTEFIARQLKPSYMAYAVEFFKERRIAKTLKTNRDEHQENTGRDQKS